MPIRYASAGRCLPNDIVDNNICSGKCVDMSPHLFWLNGFRFPLRERLRLQISGVSGNPRQTSFKLNELVLLCKWLVLVC